MVQGATTVSLMHRQFHLFADLILGARGYQAAWQRLEGVEIGLYRHGVPAPCLVTPPRWGMVRLAIVRRPQTIGP